MADNEKKTTPFSFLALDPFIETCIVSPEEKKVGGKDYILWGDKNYYPEYLAELYENCTTLRSVIKGVVDYAAGNDAVTKKSLQGRYMNKKGQTAFEVVRSLAWNYAIYGGFALQVIRDRVGNVAEIYPVNMRFLRSDKENEVFWYSEKWKGTNGSVKTVKYPKFMKESKEPSSILFIKGDVSTTYPQPLWAASVKAAEVERSIDEFHLNNINNGFMGSYIVNFNNGEPTDEIKEEIERKFNEKFAGKNNAGRIMFSYNSSKDTAATLQKMEVADYGEKYETLAKHCEQTIFKAFRANPNLFGMATESNGFNSEEYDSSFALFNRTVIAPIQALIIDAFDKVLGMENSLTIVPFTLISEEEEAENKAKEMLATQLGVGGTQSLIAIISDPNLTDEQKMLLLEKLFNFTPEEAARLFEDSNPEGGESNVTIPSE